MKERIGKCVVLNIYVDCEERWRPNNFEIGNNSCRIREDDTTVEINIFAESDDIKRP
ncbi:MAG: hypothetical protein GX235_04825 [Clostridiales bacterium]|nr:hypothetical protein [Clostridiales bacterium]